MTKGKRRIDSPLAMWLIIPSGLAFLASLFFLAVSFFWAALISFIIFLAFFIPLMIVTTVFVKKPKEYYVDLNGRRIDAVIFDMDGTLIDSTGLWHEIDVKFFEKRGMELPKDYAQNIVHLGLKEAAKFTKQTYHLEDSEQDIMDEWHKMSIEMYANDVKLKDGSLAILEYFKAHNVPMAIATANDDTLYMPCLKRLGLDKYFDHIADVNNVKEGKQSAKIYEHLAEQMHVDKEKVLVFEDMPTCVKTAYKAGFLTVAVYDKASEKYDKEKRLYSNLYINNFNEILNVLK